MLAMTSRRSLSYGWQADLIGEALTKADVVLYMKKCINMQRTSLRGVGTMTLSKINFTDEAIHRVHDRLPKVSLYCHAALAMTQSRCWEPLTYYKGIFTYVLNTSGSLRHITRGDDGDIGLVIASDCEAIQSTECATKNSKKRTA